MRHSKDTTIHYLKANRFPAVFIDLFEGRETPTNFDIIFGVPEEFYLGSELEQEMLLPEGYQPLWDNGTFDAIYCSTHFNAKIIKVYAEGGEEEYPSYLHFAAHIFLHLWELEWDEQFSEFARVLEFPYSGPVLKFMEENHRLMEFEEFVDAYNSYLAQLLAKNI